MIHAFNKFCCSNCDAWTRDNKSNMGTCKRLPILLLIPPNPGSMQSGPTRLGIMAGFDFRAQPEPTRHVDEVLTEACFGCVSFQPRPKTGDLKCPL